MTQKATVLEVKQNKAIVKILNTGVEKEVTIAAHEIKIGDKVEIFQNLALLG